MKTNITKEFTKEDVIIALAERYDLPPGAEVKFLGLRIGPSHGPDYLATCTYTIGEVSEAPCTTPTIGEPPEKPAPSTEEVSSLSTGARVRLRVLAADALDAQGVLPRSQRFSNGDEITAFVDDDGDFGFERGDSGVLYIFDYEIENDFAEVIEILPAEDEL